MINITIGADGVPSQRKIVLGNRYENNDEQVVFTLPQDFDTYNKYVIAVIKINSENITRVLPVNNNTLVVSSSLTYYSGNWSLYLMARQTEIDLDADYIDIGAKDGEHVFISDGFIGIVNKSNIEKTDVDNIPIDTNLQIVYDDLLSLKTELEKIIAGLDSNISLKVENEVARVRPGIIDEVVATVRPMIADGKSAYEIAVEHGFKGTEEEWLASLDYETSEEFNSLAAQVKEDANITSSNRTTVEQLATQVQENAAQASSSATSAQESATSASSSAVQANESKLAASTSATAAEESNQSAITHANQAKGYSDNAKTSSDNADAVKTTVEQLAGQARTYSNEANEAAQSALEAAESANQSSISAGASATSAGQFATSASKAASSATEAATNAEQSAQSAADSAQSARQFATSASQSANSASESAESAQQSATSAQESATSAGESATSAGESAESALQAEGFATQAQTSATQAASSASQASQSATNAAKSETNSANSASEAAGSAAAAQQSASSAEANAQTATTKAQEAITSAANASTSESNAATSETNAQTYMNQAKTYSETASSEADRATQATDGKLDKNQGKENVGKVMIVGEDGELTPTEYKSASDNIIYKDVAKQLNPNITDSFQRAMWNLKLYGQSTQESTTGAQLITYPYDSGDNIVLNGVNCTVNDDGSINFNGTTTAGFNYNLVYGDDYILKAGTYTFSCVGNIPSYFYLYIYDKINRQVVTALNTQSKSRTFTIDEDKTVYIYLNCGKSGSNINTTLYIMLNEGSSVLPYEPYTGGQPSPSPEYPQSITAISQFEGAPTGKNLFDISKITNVKTNLINNKDESLTINSTETSSGIGTINKLSELSNLVVGEEYILSAQTTSKKKYIYIYIDVSKEIWEFGRPRVIKQSDLDSILIFYTDEVSDTSTIKDIQIELGTTATSYEPYQSQPFTYTPTNPMYSTQDGSISDYVDVEKGVEVYNIGIATNLAQENWVINSQNDEFIKFQLNNYPLMNNVIDNPILCNMFTQINISQADLLNQEGIAKGSNGYILQIVLNKSRGILTVEDFKAFIQEMVVVYLLATPTETPIPQEQLQMLRSLYTYNGVTNFLCNAPVSFDYEQSLQIVIQNIWNAIGQTNANILLNGGNQ